MISVAKSDFSCAALCHRRTTRLKCVLLSDLESIGFNGLTFMSLALECWHMNMCKISTTQLAQSFGSRLCCLCNQFNSLIQPQKNNAKVLQLHFQVSARGNENATLKNLQFSEMLAQSLSRDTFDLIGVNFRVDFVPRLARCCSRLFFFDAKRSIYARQRLRQSHSRYSDSINTPPPQSSLLRRL